MKNSRLEVLRELLVVHKLSHILITDSLEAQYICGFHSSNITLLITAKEARLFTDFRYFQQAQKEVDKEWEVLLSTNITSELKTVCSSHATIGFQDTYMTVASFSKLQKELPQVTFHPFGFEITQKLQTKTTTEIEAISQAATIADKAYSQLISLLVTGMSEFEVASLLDSLAHKLGSEKPSFDTIVLFGERSALPHGVPSKKVLLQEGDWILIDFGCTVAGFCSDMTRTAVYGSASDAQKELYTIALTAQEIGRNGAQAGISAQELDAIVRESIKKRGYTKEFGHGTGHGVGLRIHEAPAINSKTKTLLEAHMIITIEPGVYLEGFGGVRIEDLVEVTPTGIRLLSHTPRELLEISPRS